MISIEQERWLSNRARVERRSESAILRDLIDQRRTSYAADSPDPLDAVIGAFNGRHLGTHDEILYGRPSRSKQRRPPS